MPEKIKIFQVILGPRGAGTTYQGRSVQPGFRVQITAVNGKTKFDGHPCWRELSAAEAAAAQPVADKAPDAPPVITDADDVKPMPAGSPAVIAMGCIGLFFSPEVLFKFKNSPLGSLCMHPHASLLPMHPQLASVYVGKSYYVPDALDFFWYYPLFYGPVLGLIPSHL